MQNLILALNIISIISAVILLVYSFLTIIKSKKELRSYYKKLSTDRRMFEEKSRKLHKGKEI
ncbi:hypothetical protein SB6422_02181 [Klebsiella huaxiensis]|uniref:Uncharacterized protein n=1 Tax=Klebsiella huaxiensis TaxID=2153354 RepID=A0A564LA01_9ENTR|nr:hypothetical protein SB6422_02181 [Klebsiella huaxiensis]